MVEDVWVTQGDGQCLLGSQVAKRLQVLKVGKMSGDGPVPTNSVATSIPDQFSGLGQAFGISTFFTHRPRCHAGCADIQEDSFSAKRLTDQEG